MSEETDRPLPELAAAIMAGAVRLAAATAAWLRLVAEFDERDGWGGYGVKSCAHWLAWQCGLSPGAAREHVRVARALRHLPRIEQAFAQGRLSYSKVRALTRVAEPDSEAMLIEFAREATASQTERVVRQWRRADGDDVQTLAGKQQFSYWWDDDGMLVLRARLTPDEGAPLITTIDSLAERAARRERAQATRAAARAAGPVDPEVAERCDENEEVALARERTAARRCAALDSLAGVAAEVDRRAGDPPRREVVLHVDADVLADDAAAGRAYLEGGAALTGAQARRMLCESTVVVMLERGREVLAVGRRKRRATKAQRRALLRRDGGCARPGCPENRIERLHAHHMRHWLFGGRTDLANLVLLCDADHRLVHDLDLVMTRRDGRLIVTAPDGRRVWGTTDAAFAEGVAGPEPQVATDGDRFTGVHPVDELIGRRPATVGRAGTVGRADTVGGPDMGRPAAGRAASIPTGAAPPARPTGTTRPGGPGRPGTRRRAQATTTRRGVRRSGTELRRQRAAVPIGATLFPAGEPPLPEAFHVNGERMDLRYVVSVLLGNRDLIRRAAAEAGVDVGT